MNDRPEIQFINGLMFKPPVKKDGTPLPDFIKTLGSIKVSEMIETLQNYAAQTGNEWMNFDVKVSKSTGKWYASIDTWEPTKDQQYAEGIAKARDGIVPERAVEKPVDDFTNDQIPF